MKWRRCATGTTLSRVFKGFIFVLAVKMLVLGSLLLDLPGRVATSVAPAPQAELEQSEAPTSRMAEAQAVETPEAEGQAGEAADQAAADAQAEGAPVMPGGEQNEAMKRREEELRRKEQSLTQLENEIDEKLQRLQQLETKLAGMIEQAEEIKDNKLKHLIDVYSNMKAKQAAVVIETLDPDIAVKILSGMRGRQAGEILTNVKAERAALLTEMLTNLQAPFE